MARKARNNGANRRNIIKARHRRLLALEAEAARLDATPDEWETGRMVAERRGSSTTHWAHKLPEYSAGTGFGR